MFSDWWEEQIRLAVEKAKKETATHILTVLRRQFPPSKMDDRATLDDCYMIDIIEDLACKYGVDLGAE